MSTSNMVDLVSDWSLSRVIEFLKQKEREGETVLEMDCRLFARTGIRFFFNVVDELAARYGVSRGRMCRWLTYHGLHIARDDRVMGVVMRAFGQVRLSSVEQNNRALADIQNAPSIYSPRDEESGRVSLYAYDSRVLSEFTDLSRACGVAPFRLVQLYMVRSILTCDLPVLGNMLARFQQEVDWWDKWMRFRAESINLAVSLWESF